MVVKNKQTKTFKSKKKGNSSLSYRAGGGRGFLCLFLQKTLPPFTYSLNESSHIEAYIMVPCTVSWMFILDLAFLSIYQVLPKDLGIGECDGVNDIITGCNLF